MHRQQAEVKAFEMEIGARAEDAKQRLDKLEVHAKEATHRDESSAIAEAREIHASIEMKRHELLSAEESRWNSMKAALTHQVERLEAAVRTLHAKLHPARGNK